MNLSLKGLFDSYIEIGSSELSISGQIQELIKSFLNTEMDDETLSERLITLSQSTPAIETNESQVQNEFVRNCFIKKRKERL